MDAFYFSHSKSLVIRLKNSRNKCVKVGMHQWGDITP